MGSGRDRLQLRQRAVEIPYVRVLKEDGSVVTAPADSVQDLSAPVEREAPVYTDYRQKHITVPGLRPGEILEYDIVTVIHTPLAAGHFWMEHDFDKNKSVARRATRSQRSQRSSVKMKTKPENEAEDHGEKGRRIYRWTRPPGA